MEHLGVIEIKNCTAYVTSDNQVVHGCIASLTIVSREVFVWSIEKSPTSIQLIKGPLTAHALLERLLP